MLCKNSCFHSRSIFSIDVGLQQTNVPRSSSPEPIAEDEEEGDSISAAKKDTTEYDEKTVSWCDSVSPHNDSTFRKELFKHDTVLKQSDPRYRTKPCRNFSLGYCRFGDACAYLHSTTAPPPLSYSLPSFHTYDGVHRVDD